MKLKKINRQLGIPLICLLIAYGGFSQNIEIPKVNKNDQIIHHVGYTLNYVEKYEQANWVAYVLTREKTQKSYERSNKFLVDPMVKTGSADNSDYKASGYDRGHLAPAGDQSYSAITMKESFYYSNMSPQVPGFNRGIWKKLESLVRTWAKEYDSIYVVTGGILQPGLSTIGYHKVAIPNYFYKVVLQYSSHGTKGIGFILPNQSSKRALQSYVVPIDSVEHLTGIDFFPTLPDNIEQKIESKTCINCWTWNIIQSSASSKVHKKGVSVQCSGTTQKGNQCKRKTLSPNGRCYQHGGD